jgi:hypothetical protein
MGDAFGRALLDEYRGDRTEPLYQCDGPERLVHPVEDFYFGSFADQPDASWLESRIDGPLLDVGAGAGRDVLHFQDRFEAVALEHSQALVTVLAERGVSAVRHGDMFALRETYDRDRFRSVLLLGTQVGLTGSIPGLRSLFRSLAEITDEAGTAVFDGYDPTVEGAAEMLGFRSDPTPGLAFRVINYAYDGVVGETLLFRLFSSARIREATRGTPWTVTDYTRPGGSYYYRAALAKES